MNGCPHIVSTGARTPIGLHAASSAASYRAHISAAAEHPFMIDSAGEPMPGALDGRLDPALMGPERLLTLAMSAVGEACAPFVGVGSSTPRLPLYVGLPEFRPGFTEEDAATVRAGLARMDGLPVEFSEVIVFAQGHAAGFAALAEATDALGQGATQACIVGGVDSYFQPETMEWLDAHQQLLGRVSRSGFVPGEGAGFCLLMNDRTAAQIGLGPLAQVRAVATAGESKRIKTADHCLGEGLTAAVHGAVRGLSSAATRIKTIIADINGERYRGEEWGFVCLRLAQYFEDPTAYEAPAAYWGDVGAASVPLFMMLACQAAARGYAKGPLALLWASSEGGLRGAAVLECTAPADEMVRENG